MSGALRAQPEYALHCAVADYLRMVLPETILWTTVGHGGGGPVRGAKLKRAGLRPGIADLMIAWRPEFAGMPSGACPRTLWLELKSKRGRQSSEQLEFQRDCLRVGHDYAVAYSLAEVEQILKARGVPLRGKIAA